VETKYPVFVTYQVWLESHGFQGPSFLDDSGVFSFAQRLAFRNVPKRRNGNLPHTFLISCLSILVLKILGPGGGFCWQEKTPFGDE